MYNASNWDLVIVQSRDTDRDPRLTKNGRHYKAL